MNGKHGLVMTKYKIVAYLGKDTQVSMGIFDFMTMAETRILVLQEINAKFLENVFVEFEVIPVEG